MTDKDPAWEAIKDRAKSKFDADRKQFLKKAVASDDGLWTKHTEFHWSRLVAGQRLDYWPSRKKFQYEGKVKRGDVVRFIKEKEQA